VSQGGAFFPHFEARLRIREGALRGLKKNHDHLCAAFALINLYMHRKRLTPLGA
jgi:hypothetical protein